jgi:hypothetical protein
MREENQGVMAVKNLITAKGRREETGIIKFSAMKN